LSKNRGREKNGQQYKIELSHSRNFSYENILITCHSGLKGLALMLMKVNKIKKSITKREKRDYGILIHYKVQMPFLSFFPPVIL
jgi:hypothetical protein